MRTRWRCLLDVELWPGYRGKRQYLGTLGGLPKWFSGKESMCQFRRHRRHGFDPWVWKIHWRRKWQPTPVFFFVWTNEFFIRIIGILKVLLWLTYHKIHSFKIYNSMAFNKFPKLSNYCCCLVTKLCPTFFDPMDYSPPGSSVHGILQARIVGWVAISFSSSSLTWEIPWTEESGRLQSMVLQRVGHDWVGTSIRAIKETGYATGWDKQRQINTCHWGHGMKYKAQTL